MPKTKSTKHIWRFFRSGGLDQAKLDSGADLRMLDQLDQKLWVALACPASGLNFDSATLAHIDTDQDGRVRVPELLAAVTWACAMLKNPEDLLIGSPALSLDAINDSLVEAQAIRTAAEQVLRTLGKPQVTTITVEETVVALQRFYETPFNGDGIIVESAIDNPEVKSVFADIIATLGSEPDRCGKPGVGKARVDDFFTAVESYVAWWDTAQSDTTILPLGEKTATAASAFSEVRTKVEDYFIRCRLAVFDSRAVGALNREEKDYLAFAGRELKTGDAAIAAFPLCRVEPGKALPLARDLNPAWINAMARLLADAVKPLLGNKDTIAEADWQALADKIAPFETWQAAKTGGAVEKLGIERLRAILSGGVKASLMDLIRRDQAEEGHSNAIIAVDKLVRLHRDLYKLCRNFVNFKDFYNRGEKAIFQAGTLYLDQRSCDLCLLIHDSAKHAGIAAMAGAYLVYCDCIRKGNLSAPEKIQIMAAFTDGDSENLIVGRNGVFYDYQGRDWDAVVTKIIENPISLRQAFWAPYKGFVRMIETQIAKRAAAADSAATTKLQEAAAVTATVDKAPPSAAPKKVDVGTVAALGVAFGALGTLVATMLGYLGGIVKFGPFAILGAIAGLFLLISGPSLILAYIKLRKRNLGPILDANGWAINARAKITVPLGTELTKIAKLPPGSQRDLIDPFAEKKSAWPKFIVVAVILYLAYTILNHAGFIHTWTHGHWGIDTTPLTEQRQVKE
jgi:hypothetical protein